MGEGAIRLRVITEPDLTRTLIEASRFAKDLGISEQDSNSVATCVSELARNILKYAGNGEIRINRIGDESRVGIEIVAEDRGPGIEDLDSAMRDHFSSGGTLGLGLPGVKRMMDEFEIESSPGEGTRVTIRKWRQLPRPAIQDTFRTAVAKSLKGRAATSQETASGSSPAPSRQGELDYAFFVRPCRGERVSGDAAVIEVRGETMLLVIIDALGHGREAHEVAVRAENYVRECWSADVTGAVRGLHEALRGTVGAAAGVAVLDTISGDVRYAGVGNTVIRKLGLQETRLASAPGTLGHQIRSPVEQRLRVGSADVLLFYSDGVKDRFEAREYPQFRYHGAQMIAKTVVDRFGKSHDDATCIAVRYSK